MRLLTLAFSVVFAMSTFLVSPAQAQFFHLAELVGPAPDYGDSVTVSFDLGQEFEEVREVLLLLEATATPLTILSCGTISQPTPCEPQRIPVGFLARLDDPEPGFLSAVVDGFRSDRPVRNVGAFNQVFVDFDLNSLRDGKGELTLYWNEIFFLAGMRSPGFSPPAGEILEAILVVDGTPVESRDRVKHRRHHHWKYMRK